MWSALFAFEQAADADNAASALVASGLPSDGIRIHRRASGPADGTANLVDEQVTGGILTNLYNLFQGVFDWGNSPHDSAAFETTVNRGGVVLDIQVQEIKDRDLVDQRIGARWSRRTEWLQAAP
jgi:hypothetical protein